MRAKRYDASTSKQTEVELVFSTDALTVTSDDGVKSYALDSVGFSDRLGNMPRSIYLPDGHVCETDDNGTIDIHLKKLNRKKGARFLHYVESRLRYAFFALITTGVFTYAFVIFGLPAIATYVADNIPGPVVYRLGGGTLATLDNMLLQPSALSQTRRQELQTYFTSYARTMGEWPKINVVFRSGPLGPNALALPDGTIIFTDALVNLAEHDEEVWRLVADVEQAAEEGVADTAGRVVAVDQPAKLVEQVEAGLGARGQPASGPELVAALDADPRSTVFESVLAQRGAVAQPQAAVEIELVGLLLGGLADLRLLLGQGVFVRRLLALGGRCGGGSLGLEQGIDCRPGRIERALGHDRGRDQREDRAKLEQSRPEQHSIA